MVYRDYQVLFRRILFSFCFYFLYRAVFYFYNYEYFKAAEIGETLFAYVYGIRFDLATTLIANLVFIIGSLLPIPYISYRLLLKIIFVVFNTLFLGFVVIDIEFFSFLGKKMTFDIFDMGGDIKGQAGQLIKNYWFFACLIITNGIVLWKYYPRRKRELFQSSKIKLYKVTGIGVFLFVLTAIGIRGGLQLRSISPKEAFVHDSYELGNLTLNAAYSMVRSIGKKGAPIEKYFKSDLHAREMIQKQGSFLFAPNAIGEKQNIVIIILESFSQEYINQGYAPNFKKLTKSGLYFDKNFANGRRSMEALPSIMAGIPSLLNKAIYQTQYQSNKYYALPKLLKENGYQTAFFHGGKTGTMDFDAFCFSIGFDKYFGLEDYPQSDHYDGHWGVYDHHYFNYFSKELDTYQQPFLAGIFSLSSHQPYSIPKKYQNTFPKGKLDIHESIGYVDRALGDFFEQAKLKDWYKNTLFIITADHTQKLESKEFQNAIGRYRVPLLFFHPTIDLTQYQSRRITQHADIMPSILDFVGIRDHKKLFYGNSVFSNQTGRAINFISGSYSLIRGNHYLRYDKNNVFFQQFDDNLTGLINSDDASKKEEMLQELKAYIQYTNNGFKKNNIYQ